MLRQVDIRPQLSGDVSGRRRYAIVDTCLYSIATLAGGFPDIGDHQPGEMGGVWAPPIKLLDGYWLALRAEPRTPIWRRWPGRRAVDQRIIWLSQASTWRIAPDGMTLGYQCMELGLQIDRREWIVPDESVLVVDVTLSRLNGASWQRPLVAQCGVYVRSDLHGAWLSEERLGWTDGIDRGTYDRDLAAVVISDTLHPWTVCVGATEEPTSQEVGEQVWGPERTRGHGTGAALWYRRCVDPAQPDQLRLVIAGAAASRDEARDLFTRYARPGTRSAPIRRPPDRPLSGASQRAENPLDDAARAASERFTAPFTSCVLRSPDRALDEVFAWAKADAARLTIDVPGLGRGAMAGLPEFPWWFGVDLAYGVLPLLPAGRSEDATASLRTLAALSRQQGTDGRVLHEVITNGVVFHTGNLVEIPLFVRALYHTYRWTGNRDLLEEVFPFCVRGLEQWLFDTSLEPGEQVPAGSSIVETPEMSDGLRALDVAAYFVEALDLAGALAGELGQSEVAERLLRRGMDLRAHVRTEWWIAAERLFGDVRASRHELEDVLARISAHPAPDRSAATSAERLRRALAEDADSASSRDVRRPWLLRHMVQALAADAGLPTSEQASQLFGRLESPEWTERYGIVLNAASDRQVMTLPTGALAVGEARYGRPDRALDYVRRIAATFGAAMPGALSEYSPDGGCFWQLWSSYGIVWPIVHYVFGLRPNVAAHQLICVPQLPSEWPAAQLRAVPIGDVRADVELTRLPQGLRVRVETRAPDWEVTLGVALPERTPIGRATLNGKEVMLEPARLLEHEGRQTWTAAASLGASRYELEAFWSDLTEPIEAGPSN